MLEVGNGQLSIAENRSHFSMWAMLAAPLLAGNDLPHMKPEIHSILTNKDVIAVDQDKLGKQAVLVYSNDETDVWKKQLSGGALAVAVLNNSIYNRYSSHPIRIDLQRLGLRSGQEAKDLWTGKKILLRSNMPVELNGHDILLLRIDNPK